MNFLPILFASILFWTLDPPRQTPLEAFIQECTIANVEAPDLVCLYAEDIMAFHLQRGDGRNLPTVVDEAQLWDYAWDHDVIGILAHDVVLGNAFYELQDDGILWAIYNDGTAVAYDVESQEWYRANASWSLFLAWDGEGEILSEKELAHEYYESGSTDHSKMVLQTCIGGRQGVAFIVAHRLP